MSQARRNAHYLRPTRHCGYPKRQIALAVVPEQDGRAAREGIMPLRLSHWSAVEWTAEGEKQSLWPCGDGVDAVSLWRWLGSMLRPKTCTWVWQLGACSGLTLLGFWRLIELGEWSLDGSDPTDSQGSKPKEAETFRGLCVIEDTPTIILAKPSRSKGLARFLDVGNIGVKSWDGVFASTGIADPAMCDDADASTFKRDLAVARSTALCDYVRDWCRTLERLNLGGLKPTSASQSWHGWRYSGLRDAILCHDDESALNMEREAMHSGRCEAFRLGLSDGPIYEMDIDSNYPAAAIEDRLPLRWKWTGKANRTEAVLLMRSGWEVVARCAIRTDTPVYPCQRDGLIVFPVGTFQTVLANPELTFAFDSGHLEGVKECAIYESGYPFDDYIARLYTQKRECESRGDMVGRSVAKALLNSLVGKTAQRGFSWIGHPSPAAFEPFSTWYGLNPVDGTPCRWRSIGWHTQFERMEGEHPDSVPAIAAWVMSRARLHMWNLMVTAGRENVLYCDTDSLFVCQQGFERIAARGFLGGGGIGRLTVRHIHEWIDIRGYKHYVTPHRIVCSGVPDDAMFAGIEGWSFWVPERLTDSIRSGRPPRPEMKGYRMPDMRRYRHGLVGENGVVTPYIMEG